MTKPIAFGEDQISYDRSMRAFSASANADRWLLTPVFLERLQRLSL